MWQRADPEVLTHTLPAGFCGGEVVLLLTKGISRLSL